MKITPKQIEMMIVSTIGGSITGTAYLAAVHFGYVTEWIWYINMIIGAIGSLIATKIWEIGGWQILK